MMYIVKNALKSITRTKGRNIRGVRFLFPGDILNRQVHKIRQNGYCSFSKNRV